MKKYFLEYFKELNSNGKLIRGILVNLGYSLVKDNLDYSNYLALAYELFQTSILIHDDMLLSLGFPALIISGIA